MRIFWFWAGALTAMACSDGTGTPFGTCPHTGEFANFGCARVEGIVRDTAGLPVSGVEVTLSPVDSSWFDTPVDRSDARGEFSLEMHDYEVLRDVHPIQDTVLADLRGMLLTDPLSTPSFAGPVRVKLKFVPVGEIPDVVEADLTINPAP
jgi:hypothetical protein